MLLIYWNYNIFVFRLEPGSRTFLWAWLLFEWIVLLFSMHLVLKFCIWYLFSSFFFALFIAALSILYINLAFVFRLGINDSNMRLLNFLESSLSQSLKLKLVRTIIMSRFLNYRSRIRPELRNFRLSYTALNRMSSSTGLTEFNELLVSITTLVICAI
jgi:hypothetical protein